jgi:hypothetical protein
MAILTVAVELAPLDDEFIEESVIFAIFQYEVSKI